jgi:hypothetical protein
VKLGVGDEAGVIVEKGEEKNLALALGISGVGKIGTVHRITLPQVTKVRTLETPVRFGALLGQELGSGGVTAGQLAAQGTRGDTGFGDRVGLVEREDTDDGAGGTEGLLPFEGLGAVESFRRDGATSALVGARSGLEAIKAALLVDALPASEGGGGEGASGRVGDVVGTVDDLSSQLLLAAGRVLAPDEGQDEGVAKESDFGTAIWGHRKPPLAY